MKKLLIPLIAILALSQGCIKDEYYVTEGAQVYTRMYTVKAGDWSKNEGVDLPGDQNYAYVTVNNPDITNAVIEGGTVQAYVYLIYNFEDNLASWNPLPVVVPILIKKIDTSTNTVISSEIVAENTRFEFEPGKVTFVIQDLDGYDPEDIANDMTFKVCVTI